MPYGYTGKIIHVDLSDSKIEIETPSEVFYRTYMGGSALALHYILKGMSPGTPALSEENILVFAPSVMTGSPISGQSRMTVAARSPLSGGIGDSQSGGFWPAELKFAGFDAVVVKGKANKPVYLWIHNGEVELRDAQHLWGKFTGDAENLIQEELDDKKIEVLQIGPAGEKQVSFAAVISMSNRANGRTGMGAVMGSKNLKAIAVRGKKRINIADKDKLKEIAKWGTANLPSSGVVNIAKYGTPIVTGSNNTKGTLPTYNYNSGTFDKWEDIDGTTMYDKWLRGADEGKQDRFGRDTCYACAVRCKRVVEVTEGPHKVDPHYGGPEYETTSTFGSYCGVSNLAAISKANQLCNMYGMDTISCGATISWAFEAFNEEVLNLEDTGDLDLSWGNADAMVKLTELIGNKEGFGELLSLGSAKAAQKLGKGSEFLITSKGVEAPAHMPQVKRSLALIYAVNPFGADHVSCEHDPAYEDGFEHNKERLNSIGFSNPQKPQTLTEEKVRFAIETQYLYSALDSLTLCHFVYGASWQLYGPQQTVDILKAITGWDVTYDEIKEVGQRRLNMMRIFNAREGLDRSSDTLPSKFFNKPLVGGASDGFAVDKEEFDIALETYYQMAGWDPVSGNPTPETLEKIGLTWAI